jgi:hypothetical protein
MSKLKCINGHEFDGEKFTLKCPQCGTSDFSPADGKGPIGDGLGSKVIEFAKKYKYILIGVVGLILLIKIFSDVVDPVTYSVQVTQNNIDGSIIVNIIEYKDGTQQKIPFNKNIYDKFNFTKNGEPVIWEDQNKIYVCELGNYELKWVYPESHPCNNPLNSGSSCSRKDVKTKKIDSDIIIFDSVNNFAIKCDSAIGPFGLSIYGDDNLKPNQSTTLTVKSKITGRTLFYEWYKGKIGQGSIIGKDSIINVQPDASSLYSVRVYYKENNKVYADSTRKMVYVSKDITQPNQDIVVHPTQIKATYFNNKFIINYNSKLNSDKYTLKMQVSFGNSNFTNNINHKCLSTSEFPSTKGEFEYLDTLYNKTEENSYYFRFKLLFDDTDIIESEILGPYQLVSCNQVDGCKLKKL